MSTPVTPVSQTLSNLLTAYGGENNASIKYTGFALKAEGEGFQGLAITPGRSSSASPHR